jgi:hypothetical protein
MRYVLLNTPKNQYAIFDTKKGKVLEKGEGDGIIEMQRFQEDMRMINQQANDY